MRAGGRGRGVSCIGSSSQGQTTPGPSDRDMSVRGAGVTVDRDDETEFGAAAESSWLESRTPPIQENPMSSVTHFNWDAMPKEPVTDVIDRHQFN